jgi:hypothetical protein
MAMPRWVADAKFQIMGKIDMAGSQRILSYLVDYLDPSVTHGSALLRVNGLTPADPDQIEGYRFFPLGLRPDTNNQAPRTLENELIRVPS